MTHHSTRNGRLARLLALTLAGASIPAIPAHGQAVVDPATQPTVRAAPYVLESTNLEWGPTKAYRPWFENGAWMGDVIQYNISSDGRRCTSVEVGAYPANDLGNLDLCPPGNWSARGVFPEKVKVAGSDLLVDHPNSATFWTKEIRNLFIYKPATTGNKVPLLWDQLTDAQRHAIDPLTCGLSNGKCSAQGVKQTDPYASSLLNFIRGDRSLERDKPGGVYRLRFSLMGALINSRPVFVPKDSGGGTVIAGANDGVLHAFDATSGKEIFGYVPSMVMPRLERLSQILYRHTYFVDGELRYRRIAGNQDIVAGGLGAGGKGLFALNVTSAANPSVLFEFSGATGAHIANYQSYLGHIHGRPSIARLPDGEWYVVSGNGYLSGAGARLVLVPLTGGAPTPVSIVADPTADNGLSAPALVDITGDGRADFAYAGDLKGNLWRFDLNTKGAPVRIYAAGLTKPITVEPDIGRHSTGNGIMIFFGTGSLLSLQDMLQAPQNTATQTVYGVWDKFLPDCASGALNPCVADHTLLPQTLTPETGTWNDAPRRVRVIREYQESQPIWTAGGNLGWKVDLPQAGERLVNRPQIRAGRLQFITTNPIQPTDDLDEETRSDYGSWIVQLSLESGGSVKPPTPLYDLNRSNVLDEGDGLVLKVDVNGTPTDKNLYPIGLNLGAGNIAEPSFARVIQDIDAVFINGFVLPQPIIRTELPFGGDIDVTTDSPIGPLVNPHLIDPKYPDPDRSPPAARGPMNKHLGQDGLGNRVDGHHRAYDKVHGVNFVDFFDLEPRRGKLRLDVGLFDENGNPLVVNAMKELHRVRPQNVGDIEVAGLSDTQEFIVVLTNADLSQGTEIQIGCRTWRSFDYQQMITPQLKANRPPAELIDPNNPGSLVFTLAGIRAETRCANPTLRITVLDRVGQDGVLHATLPGCVNNTHDYNGKEKTVTDLYSVDPHVTRNGEGSGRRWRNGALTMQLLAVNAGAAAYEPQDVGLPVARGNSVVGNGGIYAKGFTLSEENIVVPFKSTMFPQSGLLYESSVYWNWGDMWAFQQQGQSEGCYGMPQYNAMLQSEISGLNSAQYAGLVSELRDNEALQLEYAALLAELAAATQAGDEARIAKALEALALLFKNNPIVGKWGTNQNLSLSDYHILRHYAHQDRFKLDLITIDLALFDQPPNMDVVLDGTPAPVADVELDLLPAAGPNYEPGRRSWTDITPVQ